MKIIFLVFNFILKKWKFRIKNFKQLVKIKLMKDFKLKLPKTKIEAKLISILNNADIEELCDATEDAILVDGGFGWINLPQRKKLLITGKVYC